MEDEKYRESFLNEYASSLNREEVCSLVHHIEALKCQFHSFLERLTTFTPIIHQGKSTLTHARSKSSRVGGACRRCGSAFHWANSELIPARSVKCHKCGKVGYFQRSCLNRTVHVIEQEDDA